MRAALKLRTPSPHELELIVTPREGSPLPAPPAKRLALSRLLAICGAGAAVLMAIVLATDSMLILVGVSIAAVALVAGVLWHITSMTWERLGRFVLEGRDPGTGDPPDR